MHVVRNEILPPSGVEFAATLNLTPSTLSPAPFPPSPSLPSTSAPATADPAPRVLCNLVTARTSALRVYEVRAEPAPAPSAADERARERRARVRRGTEAVEGEVEMDGEGGGFVNLGEVKSAAQKGAQPPPMVTRLRFVREHHLHGIVTGVAAIQTVASRVDRLDRLLVSFKDAKIALMEWSDAVHDLITVSIHTYERAPQVVSTDSALFRAQLRVDPQSRCAALLLPKDAIAVLPFFQSQAELDVMDQDSHQVREVPYSPSFILDLAADVEEHIRNVIDFVFLPGFNSPTIALLYQAEQTWTGRLKEYKDTTRLIIFTLDLITQNYPVITSVDGLPYDCFRVLPTPPSLGGVLILTANAVIYADQVARRVALPASGWAPRVSEMAHLEPPAGADAAADDVALEGCGAALIGARTLLLVLRGGEVRPVEITADGKQVARLAMGPPLARTAVPSVVLPLDGERLFVGSTAGASVLLKTAWVEQELEDGPVGEAGPAAVVTPAPENGMDVDDDDDDDIYGGSAMHEEAAANGPANGESTKKTRSVLHLSLSDSIPAHGPISDITFSLAKNGDRYVPELVAATGYGHVGGFTLFQRDLPTRTKRKLHAIGGARGMWSLPIRQPLKVNGVAYERPANPYHAEVDTLILSTDANPSPGLSRIASRSAKNDITFTTRIPGTTIGAGPFFQRTAILHVMTNAVRVLEPDGIERQLIKDMDGNIPRPKIRACSICDPFVLIVREDDSIGLFIGETERGKVRRKDMSPMGDKSSRYIAGCFFTDMTGLFEAQPLGNAAVAVPDGADKNVTSTLQAAVNAGNRTQWLVLVRPQGVMEIWTLPKLSLVFSTTLLTTLHNVLADSFDSPTPSPPQDPPRKPQDMDVEQIIMAPLGESDPRLHLIAFLKSGLLAIYEAVPSTPADIPAESPPTRAFTLSAKFVKVLSKTLNIAKSDEAEKTVLAEQKRISRVLVPFVTSPTPGTEFSGVFLTGDRPSWVLASDKGGVRLYPSGHSVVHAFTACSLWESQGDFLMYTEEGPCLIEWLPDVQFLSSLPSRSVPRSRAYSHVVFEPSTLLIVAASSLKSQFTSFDEDGNQTWEPDTPDISYPTCECSTLELISPELWITMDGFEFAQNEFVNSLECVSLETTSTEGGRKDYIAVGTSVDRGEDLAVKGATYVFEVVEVVPDSSIAPRRWYKLKLCCRDEAKGPVTAVCGIDGYLVSSMGQKVFVRAFDMDERLVGVAFLDVGVYVTSLCTMKNLLLIGDMVKSVWFVAFQEDPYKLVVLAKDVCQTCVTKADFFFAGGEMAIVACDEEGIVRMYQYDVNDPESKGGNVLLCRTEFHGQVEYRSSVTIARRTTEESAIPQSKLICASPDGSLTSMVAVDEAAAKRLQLLQGQLTRNIQHMAGLNPRAFRIVRNDYTSRFLSRGILDGSLLKAFGTLAVTRQNEMTREIGTDRGTVLKDWSSIDDPW